MIETELAGSKDGSNERVLTGHRLSVVCTSWMSNGLEEAVVEGLPMI